MKKFALMITIALLFLAFLNQSIAATTLQVLAPMPPLKMTAATADCSKIVSDLGEFKTDYLNNAKIISQFVLSMSEVSKDWHSQLLPIENTTVRIANGTFANMNASATVIEDAVVRFNDWVNQIDADIEMFSTSIDTCKMSKADHEKWVNAFQVFSEKNGENLGVSLEFVSSTGTQFGEWGTKWAQIEDQEVLLPSGEFDVVREVSEGLFESADLIDANAQIAIDELGSISQPFKE